MWRSAIIVAGGTGTRMGADLPKQFLPLIGRPILFWSIEAFHRFDPEMEIILVLPQEQRPVWERLCAKHEFQIPHQVVNGGKERFHSVVNGVNAVMHDGLIAVHDGVRPLVSPELISRCFMAAEDHDAAIPVVPIASSVREVLEHGNRPVERSRLRAVQTPQCFRSSLLKKAVELPYDPTFTDEATLVERLGVTVHLVAGEEGNLKLTTPVDLKVAEALLLQASSAR